MSDSSLSSVETLIARLRHLATDRDPRIAPFRAWADLMGQAADALASAHQAQETLQALLDDAERQITDELRAQETLQQWHPIETAPKDDEFLIVYAPAYHKQVTIGYWDEETEEEGGQCRRDRVCDMDRLTPTHWMPLPPPPLTPAPRSQEEQQHVTDDDKQPARKRRGA